MIVINLLPIEFRIIETKKQRFQIQPILIALLFVFLLGSVIQFFSFISVRKKIRNLNSEMTKLSEPTQEANQLDSTISMKLLPEKYFLDQHIIPTFLMAEVMYVLSDSLPDSMWLSGLVVKRDQGTIQMDVYGYSKITYQQIAVAQIQEYVNAVKAKLEEIFNKNESELTQEVKAILTTNLQREVSDMDAMQFSVSFKSAPAMLEKKV